MSAKSDDKQSEAAEIVVSEQQSEAGESAVSKKQSKSFDISELDYRIATLKQQKTNAKSALTRTRNKLLDLLEQEFPPRQKVRDLINQICSIQCKAAEIIFELATAYKTAGDLEKFKKTCQESDPIEEASEWAINKAQAFLDNTPSSIPDRSNLSEISQQKSQISKHQTEKPSNVGDIENQIGVPPVNYASALPEQLRPNSGKPWVTNSNVEATSRPSIGEDMWKQLKRVSIPVFSGNVQFYDGWRAAFIACVDRAPATSEYKLLQLKQYLSGEAAQLVSKLGHSAAAYDIALERLDRKYGGKRRQIALRMEEVSNFKPISPGNTKDIDRFADMLDVVVVNLRENDKIEELGDGCLYSILRQKMTESMIVQYQRWIFDQQRQESVESLREWVQQEAEFYTIASESKQGLSSKSKVERKNASKSGTFFGAQDQVKKQTCHVCQTSNHDTWNCRKFKALDIDKRWDKVKQLRLCFRCLRTGHLGKNCARKVVCDINGCQATHNRLLHDDDKFRKSPELSRSLVKEVSTAQTEQLTNSQSSQTVTMSTTQTESHFSALRTIPVIVKSGNHRITVNALLDDASTQTYINEDVAAELGLQGRIQNVSVNVLNSKTESFDSMQVQFGLESMDGSIDITMTALTTTKVTGKMPVIDWQKYSHCWKHLKNISFPKQTSRPYVDILIGMDYLMLHCSKQDVCGRQGEPVARLTPLGWTCIGNVPGIVESHNSGAFFIRKADAAVEVDDNLDKLIHSIWEIEQVSTSKTAISHDDQCAVNVVKDTLVYDNGRYEVGIPWIVGSDSLSNNYDMAFSRLQNTEKKLCKDEVLYKAYDKVIVEYLQKGYIRQVSESEKYQTKWYLPHFPVVKLDRDTTKVRIVFDASAKYKGLSLNDIIHQGPKLQNDLFAILLRFRKGPIAIICDIAEMYMQIAISEVDRPYFRFLWRSDQSKRPDVYEFSRVVFGMNCSPFLAQYITQEHAKLHSKDLPLAAETVAKSTYMDDNIDSVETESIAIELYKQLKQIWSSAGMHARKWMSNSLQLLDQIPVEERLKEINIQMSELPSVKALGITWNADTDEFRYAYTVKNESICFTKRSFLRETAKVFDPLGLLAPFTIRAKIILQEMWLAGVDWDQALSPELEQKAHQWYSELQGLLSVSFPRCISLSSDMGDMKLHVFVDASQEAYGAVVYSVSCNDNLVSSQLVAAKCRVAPLKAVTIPRLELLGAVLGVKLIVAVTCALDIALKSVTLWTDSQNVLCWIRNQSRCFKQFVANRVGYIQEYTNPSQWKHVPTQVNPADILSRGAKIESLSNSSWLKGPEFLTLSEEQWPVQQTQFEQMKTSEKKTSIHKAHIGLLTQPVNSPWRLDPSRFSDWKRLCRVVAWVYRFLNNTRILSSFRKKGELSAEELQDAETNILVDAQKSEFLEEYLALSENKKLSKRSKLLCLRPFLDEDSVLRSSGRLRCAEVLSYDAKFPIILPRHHHVTKLIVKYYHEKNSHMGTNSTLSAISSRFWVISAREEIRDWERKCTWCQRRKAKPQPQIMADLPKVRVKSSLRAFESIGVDFAGPFITVQGRGKRRLKRYLCLFTCLATRAVHLEIAFGLDSDSFLNAFFRMVNRRGCPKEVISDNGTNFVGAAKELKQLISDLDTDSVKASMATRGVAWRFNPPYAPNFGGVFESLIKSAKRALVAILGSSDVSDEELMTAFTGAEALLNSRPLTYQSANPEDDIPLTPNHFLHGQIGGEFAAELDTTTFNPRRRWRRIQELVRHFWKRWLREWLPKLNVRKKWFSPYRDLQVDDVVIVVSPDTPRGQWPLGKIVKTYPGKDGHVRVVDVQIGKSVLTRTVTKVCPLEWNTD